MQSSHQKIINLINSDDTETKDLGELTLITKLNKSNAIFYYINLHAILNTDSLSKLTDILEWDSRESPMQHFKNILEFCKKNKVDEESIEEFLKYYNNFIRLEIKHGFKGSGLTEKLK